MSRFPLSDSSDWELTHDEQDIRGWDALDGAGLKIGKVNEMIVNSESEFVDTITLEDGREFGARDIHIGDGVIYVQPVAAKGVRPIVTVYNEYGRVVRKERVHDGVFAGYDGPLRAHYDKTYGAGPWSYEHYEPGYRFGYEMAKHPSHAGKSYDAILAQVRSAYAERYPEASYDDCADAAAYAYAYHREQSS